MIPKIIFRYSWIYNNFLRTMRREKKKDYPSRKEILSYIKKAEKTWERDEKKVFKEISKIAGLEWKEKFIYCYMVTEGEFSLSDPMTLVVYKKGSFRDLDVFVDYLVHESIHRIFSARDNFLSCKKAWDYINRKYKKETRKTRIHIMVHAVHEHIYLKFYSKKRLERDIKWAKKHEDYRRAWEIVQGEGYDNIIKEFQKRINGQTLS